MCVYRYIYTCVYVYMSVFALLYMGYFLLVLGGCVLLGEGIVTTWGLSGCFWDLVLNNDVPAPSGIAPGERA